LSEVLRESRRARMSYRSGRDNTDIPMMEDY
jgi:hypothetical protein